MVDIGQVQASVEALGPIKEGPYGLGTDIAENVQKADQLYDLDFEALAEAGFSTPDIAKGLIKFIAYDRAAAEGITDSEELRLRGDKALEKYQTGINDGSLNHDTTVYRYSNVAPKRGALTRFGQFMLEGATEAAFQLGTGIAVGKTAAKLTPYPKAKPVAGFLGFLGGTIAGDVPAQKAVETGQALGAFESRPLFLEERIFAKMGKVAGYDGLMVSLSPYLLPKKSANTFSGIFISDALSMRNQSRMAKLKRIPFRASRTIETNLERAGSAARGEKGALAKTIFKAGETTAVGGATIGAGIAEGFAPGDETISAVSQVGGGILSAFTPTGLMLKFAPSVIGSALLQSGSEARQNRLGFKLAEIIRNRSDGETVEEVIASIENNPEILRAISQDIMGEDILPELTPAQISGSEILSRITEDTVQAVNKVKPDSPVADEIAKRAKDGRNFTERLIVALTATGDPADLKLATQLQTQFIAEHLETQFLLANEQAIQAAARVGQGDNPEVISRNLFQLLRQVNRNAKRQEEALYEAVDGSTPVDAIPAIIQAVEEVRKRFVLRSGSLPKEIEAEILELEKAFGLRILEREEPQALINARQKVEDLPIGDVQEYDAFIERLIGVRGDPDALRLYAPDVDVNLFVGPNATRSREDFVAEVIASRKRRGFNEPERFKRLTTVLTARRALARAEDAAAGAEATALKQVGETPGYTFGDLNKFKTALQNMSTNLAGGENPNRQMAAGLSVLAQAVSDDMDVAIIQAGGSAAYERAKAFSRARNQSIVRTFAGVTEIKEKNSSLTYHPDLLLEDILSGTLSATAVRMNEITRGAELVSELIDELEIPQGSIVPREGRDMPVEIDGEVVDFEPVPIMDVQTSLENVARYAARQVLKVVDGEFQVDPTRAKMFLEDPKNQRILEAFPAVRQMIESGDQLAMTAKLAKNAATEAAFDTRIKQQDAIANVITYDSPQQAVTAALDGNAPGTEMKALIDLVKEAIGTDETRAILNAKGVNPDDVIPGLKSTILEHVWVKGGGTAGGTVEPNFNQMRQALFEPMAGGAPVSASTQVRDPAKVKMLANRLRLADLLVNEGIFTRAEMDRLEFILQGAENIQVANAGGRKAGKLVDEQGDLVNSFFRILGSGTVGAVSEKIPGLRPQGLIEAGIGARLAGKVFGDIPQTFQIALLEKAVTDPQFMIQLLRRGKTQQQKVDAIRGMRAYLAGAGFTLLDEDRDETVDEYFEDPNIVSPAGVPQGKMKRRDPAFPAVPNIIQPGSGVSAAPKPFGFDLTMAPSAPAQTPPQPDTRRRMAAAFPGDGIMGLLGTG